MAQKILMVFGVILVLVGVLGFIPGITNDDSLLLGIFAVDGVHNVIHLLSGILAIAFARMSMAQASMFAKVLGVVYALVAILGLVNGESVLGIIDVNLADNVLHILLAVVFLYAGFGKSGSSSSMPMQA